jgi:survival-of-motor-neuron-related-splicing factor 30
LHIRSKLINRYPARISAVVGSKETPLYTITFKGYSSSTNVPLSQLRPHDPNAPIPQPVQKRKVEEPTEREKEKKKAKGEKWMEKQQARADEAKGKQSAWAKFGKKAQKKGIHIAGLEGKSVFKTSDSVTGRGKLSSILIGLELMSSRSRWVRTWGHALREDGQAQV